VEVLVNRKDPHTPRSIVLASTDLELDGRKLVEFSGARAEDLGAQTDQRPQVFSMASWQHRQFNERARDIFLVQFALDPTWVKNQPYYEALRTYGAIAT
jgi:hypothetical protein